MDSVWLALLSVPEQRQSQPFRHKAYAERAALSFPPPPAQESAPSPSFVLRGQEGMEPVLSSHTPTMHPFTSPPGAVRTAGTEGDLGALCLRPAFTGQPGLPLLQGCHLLLSTLSASPLSAPPCSSSPPLLPFPCSSPSPTHAAHSGLLVAAPPSPCARLSRFFGTEKMLVISQKGQIRRDPWGGDCSLGQV